LRSQVHLHVPPERSNADRKRLDHVGRRRLRSGGHEIEANAAHPKAIQSADLRVAHRIVQDGDGPGVSPYLRHRLDRAAIISAIR